MNSELYKAVVFSVFCLCNVSVCIINIFMYLCLSFVSAYTTVNMVN